MKNEIEDKKEKIIEKIMNSLGEERIKNIADIERRTKELELCPLFFKSIIKSADALVSTIDSAAQSGRKVSVFSMAEIIIATIVKLEEEDLIKIIKK